MIEKISKSFSWPVFPEIAESCVHNGAGKRAAILLIKRACVTRGEPGRPAIGWNELSLRKLDLVVGGTNPSQHRIMRSNFPHNQDRLVGAALINDSAQCIN